ncbi:MAG: HAMP domain-containing histidine kinase [Ruminiclostridium sp.]|jgi:signal transduction histidine kinase|nr:HAMP domain-containing histidine kinase [Ruminiclostridium sp.]
MAKPGFSLKSSLQLRLTMGYAVLIAALLVLMNTYPLVMSQNLMFRSQQTALENQGALVANSLTTADNLTPETVEQAIAPLDKLDVSRLLVTDEAGLVLFDSQEAELTGRYALSGEIVAALEGNNAFSSQYASGCFSSCSARPVMTRNTVVGAVCLYGEDLHQGALLQELQRNLRLISLVVCLAVLALFAAFSTLLSRRVGVLLGGIRRVRAGEYAYRVTMKGHDELAQLADEFNQLTGRLQATEAQRRRFVSDASHELKTPLASIRLLTDSILQDEAIDQETTREFVEDISQAADRLIHISEGLLSLNRVDEGRTIGRERVDVNQQAEALCRLLIPLAEEAGVRFQETLGEDCTVRCSREDVSQILRNLMENAIKYNIPGGTVCLRTFRQGEEVVMEVEDSGVGIPEEELPRIFERFYRVDKARSREAGGSGLGLSIVLDTLRLYGGDITARSAPGEGSCFTAVLPAWSETEEEAEP